ncbi:MAG: alanine--tRNA ligase [Firmicutes bacterium]|nr:alanine--tRNA ligase [Bacillota bacterium]
MSVSELREMFLQFFEGKGHRRLPSASLIPHGDPTLLLTGAGMVPFKPYFLGKEKPPSKRITTCQRCLRTADIDNVGKTDRHGTFFEMLGNFSFGDYFKREAIHWAWEFTTKHLELPVDRLWVTIYLDDDEAFQIWNEEIGVPKDRIVRLGREDNFWEIGVGPCGPCSELHLDRGPEYGCGSPDCKPGCDCERYLEFWNLVFIQYHQDEAGNLVPLEQTGIDTGMGLDRAAAILQGVNSIFETDALRSVMDAVANLVEADDEPEAVEVALRVIADHTRSVTFLVSDGVLPSNEGRGYVLRRLLRRAVRYGRLLGIRDIFLPEIAQAVMDTMGDAYPELIQRRDYILEVIRKEEERFQATLDQGLRMLKDLMENLEAQNQNRLSGDDAFRLYDTYGFPLELTKEILAEEGMEVDEAEFAQRMEEQRQRARAARGQTGYLGSEDDSVYVELAKQYTSQFVGYDQLEVETIIEALLVDGQLADEAEMGQEIELVLAKTPFYAEGGGQVADTGTVTGGKGALEITGVESPVEGLIIHKGRVTSGLVQAGDTVMATVYQRNRDGAACHHTATHLLHKALKEVLGEHVNQAGSLVEPDRLRFDFTHLSALTREELDRVEKLVNDRIRENLEVTVEEMSLDEARADGAIALFDEKYEDRVRVISVGDYSRELCGGTHVRRTGDLGIFKIISEGAVAAGVRRIEALTGKAAVKHIAAQEAVLHQAAEKLQTTTAELPERIDKLLQENRELARELERLKAKLAAAQSDELLQQAEEIAGLKVLSAKVEGLDAAGLRTLGDRLREKLGSGVILLGSAFEDKALFLAMVTPDIVKQGIKAGDIVKVAAQAAGGGGGGRPDMAQAGGREPAKIDAALELAVESIKKQLAAVQ